MSATTEPCSTETTSQASVFISNKTSSDDRSRSTTSLNCSNCDRNIATQPLTGGENVVRNYHTSPHYMPLALIAMILNPLLGIPASVCSCISSRYRKSGDSIRSSKYSELALWLSIIAIASSLVIIIFVLVYAFVITPNIILNINSDVNESFVLADEVSYATSSP